MKKWVLKAIVQKTISYLPWSKQINYFFQKYVTKGVYLNDTYFGDRLGHARAHLDAYQRHTRDAGLPDTCLEIGTGWYPVVPISFFLAGANRIYSVDISFLTSKERIYTTLQKFLEWKKKATWTDTSPSTRTGGSNWSRSYSISLIGRWTRSWKNYTYTT